MPTEITAEQAEEATVQLEMICAMLEEYPNNIANCELAPIASLLKKLAGNLTSYLIEIHNDKE